MASSSKGKIFFAEITKGYVIKVLIDVLSDEIPRPIFRISPNGLHIREMNDKGHILVDVDFPRNHFDNFKCSEDEIIFDANFRHLKGLTKSIKKKDTVFLCIERDDPSQFKIVSRSNDRKIGSRTHIGTEQFVINYITEPLPPSELPEIAQVEEEDGSLSEVNVYSHPVIISSADYREIKKLLGLGKIIKIKIQDTNYISFSSDCGGVMGSQQEFGEIVVDEDDDELPEMFESEYNMNGFTMLMKLPGLCSKMQFYAPQIKGYPLKVVVQAGILGGTLGDISIYIKDIHMIAFEDTQRQQKECPVVEPKTRGRKRK